MENLRIVKSFLILIGGMLLLALATPFFIFAYDDDTTHPALTDEIVDHFLHFYPAYAPQLSASQKELVKQGSTDEDSGVRWLWHFYDPIKNRGLVFGNDDLLRNPELAAIIGSSRSEWQSSKEWAQDTTMQAGLFGGSAYGSIFSFFSAQSDFSWERAIYEYAWGDKNRAMLALGHILHLIEDASVPDHTRNDPHPHVTEWSSILNESPYEIWTRKFTPGNFTASINASPIILGSLDEYFDSMARYSNGNFFSKDTILNGYVLPEIQKEVIEVINSKPYRFGIAFDESGGIYKLVKVDKTFGEKELTYSLVSPSDVILTDYWSHLSKQAILHGAGVMKLFFDEVAREQQTKTLYYKNRSWWQKAGDGIVAVWSRFTNDASSSAGLLAMVMQTAANSNTALTDTNSTNGGNLTVSIDRPTDTDADSEVLSPAAEEISHDTAVSTVDEISTELVALFLISAEPVVASTPQSEQNQPLVFLAGGAGPVRKLTEVAPPAGGATSAPTSPDTTPPDPPIITAPIETTQTANRITFSGTAEASVTILTDFNTATTTAIEVSPLAGGETSTTTGTWTLALALPHGTTTISFFAKDSAGNISIGAAKTVFVDSEKPDLIFSIAECAASLSSAGCLVATTTLAINWFSNANDLASYKLSCATNGNACENFSYNPYATSAIFIAENNHTYIFTAKARDISGNESEAIQKIVEVRTSPVIINEIAWAGTASSTEDEWIELKNNSAYAIDFNGAWVLRAESGTPSIVLSGSIPAGEYYLLERKDNLTVSDIAADQTYGNDGSNWALNNTGEVLMLSFGDTTIDQTPAVNACGNRLWCGGDTASKITSERIDPLIAGTNPANWVANNGVIKNGKDAANNALNGTPKARNSVNYAIASLWSVLENRALTKAHSPYLIDNNGFTIPAGKTLTVAPGAVVKFTDGNNTSLIVNGTLKAEGIAADPVVFTSIYDDAYAGDTNNDGICNPHNTSSTALCPQSGLWKQIYVSPTSDNTAIRHAVIRYGGRWFTGMPFRSMLAVDDAEIQLTNSILEYSWGHGLRLADSNSVIENNTFRHNTSHDNDTGFFIGGGSPTIRGNTSSYNSVGSLISNVGGVFSDNIFSNNVREALTVSGSVPAMTNSAASANGANGILLQSFPSSGFSFQAGLPYLIEDQPIFSSGSYLFAPGSVLKFKTSSSALTFNVSVSIAGTGINPIVFTDYADDGYGGDTNNDGICASEDASSTAACPYAGAWRGLKFTAGADGSTLNNIIVRYGGSHSDWAGLKADGASIAIQNSIVEKNSRKGIWLLNSASTTIVNTVIRNHKKPDNDATVSGLYLSGSHVDIGGLTFRDNTIGINALPLSTITITAPLDIDN